MVVGRVEDVRPVEQMPEFADLGFETGGEFAPKNILRAAGVDRVAAISYHTSPHNQLMFVALEIGGDWFDQYGQALAIEIVGVYS